MTTGAGRASFWQGPEQADRELRKIIIDAIGLIDELNRRGRADQDIREELGDAPWAQDVVERMNTIDADNTAFLAEVIAQYGWPGLDIVGEEGARHAWLIAQHAEFELQQRWLPLLERAVALGRAEPAQAAFLQDRVLMRRGEKQRYGTQLHLVDAEWERWPIVDPEGINTRRLAAAMEPLTVRTMRLYRQYFELVASGRKTIEVRVRYPQHADLAAGDLIRFTCDDDSVMTAVRRVAMYGSFDEMIDAESPAAVDPDVSREQQLANIRAIYGPEKEVLGVLAIDLRLAAGAPHVN